MLKKKKSIRLVQIMAISSVIVAPIASAIRHTVFGYVLAAISLIFFVKVMPFTKKRENLWMFFLVSICSVPINTSLIFRYITIDIVLWCLLLRSMVYLLLLSLEEIIMGYITRLLWVRQYRVLYTKQSGE